MTTKTTKPEATKAARKPRVKPESKTTGTVEDGLKPKRIARAEKALGPDFSIERLQFLIVDALEDMKGQSISVFNTQALSDLFDRVVIASGTSNRQTRALASNVIKPFSIAIPTRTLVNDLAVDHEVTRLSASRAP